MLLIAIAADIAGACSEHDVQQTPNLLLSSDRLTAEHATCSKLRSVPQDATGPRDQSGRYVKGSKPVLIRNATIWTGEPVPGTSLEDAHAGKGYAWISSDVYMEHGLIKRVEPAISVDSLSHDCDVWDAQGGLLTSGIVDMHSHTGVDSLPDLVGSEDTNELSNDITPYVRSIDGLNPLDPQLQVIKSGGVTTSLVLPGSGNNIGGEAFVIKHAVGKPDGRPEISAEDMLADPEKHWRYMKMACGENAKRVYGTVGREFGPFSRLGEAWYFRHAFEQASTLVKAQDDWCDAADRLGAENMPDYLPMDLHWESLGAVLRGQVMVNTHCYTIPDLEAFVRHTNEFKFPVRAFHHAHGTYLVPEILKRAYGDRPPAAALFADNMYYKAEAYVASEQAGKILYDSGITPVYVSDNPVLNAQHVVFEAAKAYRYGLPYHAALAGVTSASAELLGLGERIGKVKPGFDADIVVWDSDPLSVGATPIQVWIDGTAQYDAPVELKKPAPEPMKPDIALADVGAEMVGKADVIFAGVSKVVLPGTEYQLNTEGSLGHVVVRKGVITCVGRCQDDILAAQGDRVEVLQLRNGHLAPPITAFGSFLGVEEIAAEEDTQDGENDESTFSAALDGLLFGSKSLNAAYSHGVTRAISAPAFKNGGHKGVSVGFKTGALHALDEGAVWNDEAAAHYTLTLAAKQGKTPSLSSAVSELRTKLLKAVDANATDARLSLEDRKLNEVVAGKTALVIDVHSADIIASVLRLKAEVEAATAAKSSESHAIRLVIFGGAESHLLAPELAAANVSVVLAPLLAYGVSWDQRRSLTGAPLTNGTAIGILHAAGVKVAIGTSEDWETRDLALYAGIAHVNSGGKISESEALKMVSSNIYEMLGLKEKYVAGPGDFVVYDGNPLQIDSRVRAVADGRGVVSVWT
ncbi:hypothetical protein LTR36_001414 [Oleoguttula mirabilis]|uniref:Amidohydrolase-related domain-containing protein n=1 Tax=Oleoguttula mirabilis TaxID=1507867 RepID=A0AAV9JP97_9PEZI|nr:hypothetical protein LTR36_001414 [Oleoguttula mirabilis]